MIATESLSAAELAALLHFHADAGVEWLLEETPVDRFAEFEAAKVARRTGGAAVQQTQGANPQPAPAARQAPARPLPQPPPSRQQTAPQTTTASDTTDRRMAALPASPVAAVAIPDEQAISEARFAAESARSLAELKAAMEAFTGCNLKNSARTMVFASGEAKAEVMVIGPAPSGDDDRDGLPFSGKPGQMLDRMLGAIGLARETVLLGNVIPWRPPGNRVATPRETDICRPFIERQIALAEPRHLLILGNFAVRFFFGGTETIHNSRGEWRDVQIGGQTFPALATLHPQDLMSAPASKRLAWQDLLAFQARIRG
ncbi:uracil-DNA glycosylase [Pararhizobium antarcticum]|uniref:Type-4 uracil-DNA glycosylase n=1 Tax=Pararhizobium antarcticum TaxID=1798805 RepID=A0A657LVD7_9HYPH|nr:uracil-DNA glycosylase [Pararhizobium antarcticum]OJF97387.1 DNA polymerase [Rhizobium sp. 58]OJF98081.1 DNA polymerase [Pararhizobium antarcticum]